MVYQFISRKFAYSSLSLALFAYFGVISTACAEEPTRLDDIQVVGKKRKASRKDNEITGLGKIVKNSDAISKEQVLNIRDLVRYDPGVTVVEQGRGGSAGYSMRGVDKNRVALVVDGIPQAQSYVMQGEHNRARHGGGSINEIENENIASVEISKGASSAEYGSGSLGGAIGFRTKEPSDILSEGHNWGLATKSAYSSKNKQATHSIGFAGRANNVEALIQYTDKKGQATQIHRDAINTTNYTIRRLGYYLNEYDFRYEPNQKSSSWFLIEGECQSTPCQPRAKAAVTDSHFRYGETETRNGEFTPEEKAVIDHIPHIKETLKAEDYTGTERVIPDPMTYRTGSWLAKVGYHFNPKHYVGGVFEETKQRYDIRDMTTKSYYSPSERNEFDRSLGIYTQTGSPLDGLSIAHSIEKPNAIGLRWSRTQFFDENHKKVRKGVVYRYQGDKASIFDHLSLSWDNQKITLDSQTHNPHCVAYPNVDKNCRPSLDKPWSFYASERNIYTEQHNLVKLALDKQFNTAMVKHKFTSTLGLDEFKSVLNRQDYYQQYAIWNVENVGGNGLYETPYIYRIKERKVITEPLCHHNLSAFRDCRTRLIKGRNQFITLNDNIRLNQYVDIGVGGRLEHYQFKSDDPWVSSKNYRAAAWNVGLVLKPTKHIAVSYRLSNGFRIPSFQEMFGYRTPGLLRGVDDQAYQVSDLSPEKSLNKEVGIGFKGDFGSVELSYFRNRYQDLITLARKKEKTLKPGLYGYYNAQSIEVEGINLIGKLDWNGIFDKLPEGLYSNLAYNKIKPTKVTNHPNFIFIRSYAFDALQPSRYIMSLGYEQPENKWGINAIMTYSKGKNASELVNENVRADASTYRETKAQRTTKSWYTVDVIGHLQLFKNVTARAGIYNLMNYRYVTWEAVRQSATGAINQHHDVTNYARYAAPGRNFTLSLEAKF